MEWRIFLPQPDVHDYWIPPQLMSAYAQSIEDIVRVFGEGTREARVDEYLVGEAGYGIKYRNQKKWEIKIRDLIPEVPPGTEHWTKDELGKKSLSHYKERIIEKLNFSSLYDENTDVILSQPTNTLIKVFKSRKKEFHGIITIEICYLSTNIPDEVERTNRLWISIGIEGGLESVKSTILELPQLQYIWTSLRIASHICKECGKMVSNLGYFIPILSGYPAWIKYIAGQCKVSEVEALLQLADRVLKYVQFPPSEPSISYSTPNTSYVDTYKYLQHKSSLLTTTTTPTKSSYTNEMKSLSSSLSATTTADTLLIKRYVVVICRYNSNILLTHPPVPSPTLPPSLIDTANTVTITNTGTNTNKDKDKVPVNQWDLPSDFVFTGETIEQAAVRITREQTGVDVSVDGLLGFTQGVDSPCGLLKVVLRVSMTNMTSMRQIVSVRERFAAFFSLDQMNLERVSEQAKYWGEHVYGLNYQMLPASMILTERA